MPSPSRNFPATSRTLSAPEARAGEPSVLRVLARAQGALGDELRDLRARTALHLEDDSDLAALVSSVELAHEIPVEALGTLAALLTRLYDEDRALSEGRP